MSGLTSHNLAIWLPIVVVLAGFVAYCEIQVVRQPARYLPKLVWALIVIVQIPLGGIAYLVFGRDFPKNSKPLPSSPELDGVRIRPRPAADARAAAATPVVRTRALTKIFAGGVGLHAVDLEVPGPGVYGLVGPNGAGKTTLLSLLAGLRRADSGDIVTDARVLLCPDTPSFEPWMTASETVRAFGGTDVDRHLALTGLGDVRDRRVGGFSRGMAQRLGLAVVLSSAADVLLLDEPTSALDPQGRADILDLIQAIGRDRAVIFSSHILADIQRVADTVGVLRDGQLLYQGPVADLLDRHTRPSWRLHLRSGSDELTARLSGRDWVAAVHAQPQGLRVDTTSLRAGETLLPAEIAASGAELIALNPIGADLESVFLDMVGAGA